MNKNKHLRKPDSFTAELKDFEKNAHEMVRNLTSKKPHYTLQAHQAEWHIRCLIYHCRNLLSYYTSFTKEVSSRAATGADILWMYSQDFQYMLFELYGLVNIARISMDNLRFYLSPLFKTPSNQLPKSVKDFLKGDTDCPIYQFLSKQDLTEYLIDLRNCLVHYRSFASSDNALVFEDKVDESELVGINKNFFSPMARAYFRRLGDSKVSVNVFLPDIIFETDSHGNKKLAKFTYIKKWNLLSMAFRFTLMVSTALIKSLEMLRDKDKAVFSYKRKKE